MYQGFGYIVVIIIFSILYNILKFFELETVYYVHNVSTTNASDLFPADQSFNATFMEAEETER